MAKLNLDTLMTKISYVFKADSYILNYKYAIAGKESYEDTPNISLIIFNEESSNVLKESFPLNEGEKEKLIFFKNIKKAKKEFDEYTEELTDEESFTKIRNKVEELEKGLNNVKRWFPLDMTEDEKKSFLVGGMIELFSREDNIPNLSLTKNLFPMLSDKNVDDLVCYAHKENSKDIDEDNLWIFNSSLNTEWFQIFSTLGYLDVDSE